MFNYQRVTNQSGRYSLDRNLERLYEALASLLGCRHVPQNCNIHQQTSNISVIHLGNKNSLT